MSDEDDDNFVIIGEALEPLDEDNLPRKKPVTIEDQYALDAQGRRRFHGAFTGGFSAGYFNSVGTRDGWRPHQFKSSRSKKAENVCQRPEDFMDDEDTSEFGIAPIGIRASSDFSNHNERGVKRGRPRIDDNGPIPGTPVLRELLKPVTDTVGVKLLKKMGWKPGQGVGPRITKREKNKTRKKIIGVKVYGCSLPNTEMKIPETHSVSSDNDDDDGDDEVNEEIFFAPDDFEPFRCNPKDNYFGIGYSGLNKLSSLSGHINLINAPAFQMQDRNKKLSIRGQAFGVGAFEADDDDIYERDDMSRYDFTLGPEIKKNNRMGKSSASEPLGCRCLEGFVLAENRLERKKLFSPPKLSENFKPIHVIRKSRFSPVTNENEITNKLHWKNQTRPNLNAQDRERILNDYNQTNNNGCDQSNSNRESLVKHNQSIEISSVCTSTSKTTDLVDGSKSVNNEKSISKPSWMDKLTMKTFVSGGIEGSSKQNLQNSSTSSESKLTSILDETCDSKTSNQSRLNSIPDLVKPFIHDGEKQSRFEKFLEFSMDDEKEKLEHIQPLSMDKWERQREFEEFKMVAKSFKNVDVSRNEKNETECKITVHDLSSENCAVNAAKMKMFGKFTRTIDTWRPASAVCKRFNISEPKSGCAQPDIEKVKKYRLFESLDFCGGVGTSDIKFQKADSISNDNECKNEEPSVSNHSNAKNQIKLLDTANLDMISSKPHEKLQNLEDIDHKIIAESIDSIPNTDIQRSESDFKKDNEIAEGSKSCLSDVKVNVNPEAKADLFKAIFLSSSEESDSDEEPSEDLNSETVKSLLIGKSANELNTQRNTSPARGIFAQLNLDEMVRSSESTIMKHEKSIKSEDSGTNSLKNDINDAKTIQIINKNSSTSNTTNIEPEVEIPKDLYGPALPIKLENSHKQSSCNQSHSEKSTFKSVIVSKLNNLGKSSKWIEKLQTKKLKKAKKKHKQKEKRKDRKHKHKSKRKKND